MKTAMRSIPPLFIALLLCTGLQAQKNFYKEAEKRFANKEFYSAIEPYKKAYEKAGKKQKAEILYRIGLCYRNINDPRQAEVYLGKSIRLNYQQTDPTVLLYYADALRMQEKYAQALGEYQQYKDLVPSDHLGEDGIRSCGLAVKWKQEPTRYEVSNMVQINTAQWDYAPSYADKKYRSLIISSTREGIDGGKEDVNVGQRFSDLFFTQVDNKGKWTTPVPLPSPVNSEVNEAADVVAKKSNVMYFTRCEVEKNIDVKCKLYISLKKGNVWDTPSVLPFCADSFNFGHPAINPEENILVFSSDMAGGAGGLDLWYSVYDKRTKTWSAPVNLGPEVNTPGDEAFPFIHDDGTLYFASTGHLGMGGYDIFSAKSISQNTGKKDDANVIGWSKVENMRAPINSAGDDFGIIFEGKKERGYFTSNRFGGKGGDDIYAFNLPPLCIRIKGYVTDADTHKPIKNATVKLLGSDGLSTQVKTDSLGYYVYDEQGEGRHYLSQGNSYIIGANATDLNYLGNPSSKFTTIDVVASKEFRQDFELKKIGIVMKLPLILYNTNSAELNHSSNPKDSLEYLYNLLTENPNITIELMSHTDYRMPTSFNDTLSLRRAKSCVDYLVSKGIAPDRITPKGYGERKPLTLETEVTTPGGKVIPKGTVLNEAYISKFKSRKEDYEFLLQLDRRTEFKVLRKDYVPHDGTSTELKIDLDDSEEPEGQN
jgi:peptidoglycan-associated lipoprotein